MSIEPKPRVLKDSNAALYCDYVAKSKVTDEEAFRFTLMCIIDGGYTARETADRLVAAGFIGHETVKQLQVIVRKGMELISTDIQGNILHTTALKPEDLIP
jgi:c-di-GMP-binding flagellar brake protein YcgR